MNGQSAPRATDLSSETRRPSHATDGTMPKEPAIWLGSEMDSLESLEAAREAARSDATGAAAELREGDIKGATDKKVGEGDERPGSS